MQKYQLFKKTLVLCTFIFVCNQATSSSATNSHSSENIQLSALSGKWKCTEEMDYMGYAAKSEIVSEFKPNGQYFEKNQMTFIKDNEKAIAYAQSEAQWNLQEDILTIDQNKLLKFEIDNAQVEEQLNLKSALSDPDAVKLLIKKLDNKEMIANFILFDTEIENLSRVCVRQ